MKLAAAVIFVALVAAAVAAEQTPVPLLSRVPRLAEGAPWPVARGDGRNTGRVRPGASHVPPASISPWRFPTDSAVVADPVIDAAERIYVGAADGTFYVFDPLGGREVWRVALGEPVTAAAALGPDGVIYAAVGTRVVALSADGGTQWAFDAHLGRDDDRVSFGVRDLWQGGLGISLGGNVCAGNDDFFVYCLEPPGRVLWARRTGLPVWAPVAFGRDGVAYVASLDMNLYALEADTGEVRWRRDLGAPLGVAVAVGDDETLYVSAMDGQLHAVDGGSGRVRWSTRVGAPVLSAPAVAADGAIYVGSTDGRLSALDAASGAPRWSYLFGNPLRAAPAIGPDPEGIYGHLVYVVGGDGGLYAMAPDGRPRWVYDAAATGGSADLPRIETGPSLGRYGVTVGAVAGELHYVPYDHYLRDGAAGIRRPPAPLPAPQWRVVSPAGILDESPLATAEANARAVTVGRAQVVTLRAILEDSAAGIERVLSSDRFDVRTMRGKYRGVPLGDGRSLALVPQVILPGATTVPLSVSGRFPGSGGTETTVEGHAALRTEAESVDNPIALRLNQGFRLTRLAVSQPPSLAALVSPALHAVTIPFVVVESLPERQTFAAWGLQSTVPAGRTLLYALRGQWNGDTVVLEATSIFFDLGGVTLPVDRLRFAGRFVSGGRIAPGATLFAEVRLPGLWDTLNALLVDGGIEGPPRTWLREVLGRGSAAELLRAAARTVPAFARFVARRPWEPLGIVNSEGEIVAVGTFDMTALPARELVAPPVRVRSIEPDVTGRRVVAEVVTDGAAADAPVVAILLVDTATGAPVPLDYNRQLVRERRAQGTLRVELRIPITMPLPAGRTRAHVMADLASLAAVTF